MKKIILSWIIFHGITDIFRDNWVSFYMLSPLFIYLPMDIINTITCISSIYHFDRDDIIPLEIQIYLFPFLLYYGLYRVSQCTMVSYMCFLHVPIHLSRIHLDYYMIITLMVFYICVYNCEPLLQTVETILRSGGRLPNNNHHKLILGIVNAHIFTNSKSLL